MSGRKGEKHELFGSSEFPKLVDINQDHVDIFLIVFQFLFAKLDRVMDAYSYFIDGVRNTNEKTSSSLTLLEVWNIIEDSVRINY
jgi:hypothetical protein